MYLPLIQNKTNSVVIYHTENDLITVIGLQEKTPNSKQVLTVFQLTNHQLTVLST